MLAIVLGNANIIARRQGAFSISSELAAVCDRNLLIQGAMHEYERWEELLVRCLADVYQFSLYFRN